ncbi:MAG TPA: DUF1616 domain-containing protein, partial [Methanosarcina sp.]|nr:DUF1616 domain-containing protein [Methanosarcina sp.]
IILIFVSLAFLASGCEEKLSAEEIVEKMQEKEASLEDYSGTINTTIYLNGEKDLEEETQIIYKKPNLMKTLSVEEGKEVESVSDGEFVWSYDAKTNTVTKIKLPEEPLLTEKDFVSIIGNFVNESNVSMIGIEEVDGRSAYVLEARPKTEENESELASRTKIWVDRDTWMVLKSSIYNNKGNLVTEVEIRDLKINTGIPDSEFKFEIPEGAKVETLDLDEELKVPDNLSLEEVRQQASFEILVPEYIPDDYMLNSTTISGEDDTAAEGQDSETVILSYQKGAENFDVIETVYENKSEENTFMEGAEKISINGKEGTYLNEFGDTKMLQWKLGGVEINLIGSLEKTEMLKIAESFKEPFTEVDILDTESLKEPFTEFYIMGPDGTAKNYPTDYVLGENGTVIVRIINHEQKPVNYTMEVKLEDTLLPIPADWKNIRIEDNDTLEKAVPVTPPFVGTHMNLNFLLYNNDKKDMLEENVSVPYRNLNLWINVTTQNLSNNDSTRLTAI